MNYILVFGWLITAAVAVLVFYLVFRALEYLWCVHIKDQVPFEPSSRALRRAVSDEINAHYANLKTVCEIGGGYGGMSRWVAKHCKKKVISLENMPFTYAVARVADFLFGGTVRTVRCDAFAHLDNGANYDIGIAYLGPWIIPNMGKYSKNFKVLITIDVPINGIKPCRIVELPHGYTIYAGKKYPNKLFVYEF